MWICEAYGHVYDHHTIFCSGRCMIWYEVRSPTIWGNFSNDPATASRSVQCIMDNLADRNMTLSDHVWSASHRIHGAGIYANIGGILMVNVTIYRIHRSYGYGTVNFDAKGLKAVHCTYHTDPYTCFHRYTEYALAFATLVGSNILFRCWDWRIRFVFIGREDAKCITCIVFQVWYTVPSIEL